MKIQFDFKKPYLFLPLILILFFCNGCKTCHCPSYTSLGTRFETVNNNISPVNIKKYLHFFYAITLKP